jgi:hypothetical protein
MKSVCGGGKTYAAIEHIISEIEQNTWHRSLRFIYAVPKIDLAEEIELKWAKRVAERKTDRVSEPELDYELTVIHSNKPNEKKLPLRVLLKGIVTEPYKKQVVLVTHQTLFSGITLDDDSLEYMDEDWASYDKDSFDGPNFIGRPDPLEDWHVFIDENPVLVKEEYFPDDPNAHTHLGEIVGSQCEAGRFSKVEVTKEQKRTLARLTETDNYNVALDSSVRALMEAVILRPDTVLLALPKATGFYYYTASFTPLVDLVDRAEGVTILSSNLAGFTPTYLKHYGIDCVTSDIKPRNDFYPKSLQKRISIWKVFKHGNMGIDRLEKYGAMKLTSEIADTLEANLRKRLIAGRDDGELTDEDREELQKWRFLLRANDLFHRDLREHSKVTSILSKEAFGLNSFKHETTFVDIASYNRTLTLSNAYKQMDEIMGIQPGRWETSVIEAGLELSAQAAFRIGIREIDIEEDIEYSIVLPDSRTESYIKRTYLPDAIYKGWIIDDGSTGKSTGRPKAVSVSTLKKAKQMHKLIAEGVSQRDAAAMTNLSRGSYINCREAGLLNDAAVVN